MTYSVGSRHRGITVVSRPTRNAFSAVGRTRRRFGVERTELTVRGEGVSKLPNAIGGYPRGKRVDYDGDGFYVVVTEQYFARTNSNLQATTVFELVDETTCRVAIFSGGGGSGLLQFDWWSESSEQHRIVRKIEHYAEEHDLAVERG